MANEIVRTAHARWHGDMKQGTGNVETPNKALDNHYSTESRFAQGAGTNPEELLAASHAACFAMALANVASSEGYEVRGIDTDVKTYLDPSEAKQQIKNIEIDVTADIPGINNDQMENLVHKTQGSCIVSQALKAVPMQVRGKVKENNKAKSK